jgi:hypothetical protein
MGGRRGWRLTATRTPQRCTRAHQPADPWQEESHRDHVERAMSTLLEDLDGSVDPVTGLPLLSSVMAGVEARLRGRRLWWWHRRRHMHPPLVAVVVGGSAAAQNAWRKGDVAARVVRSVRLVLERPGAMLGVLGPYRYVAIVRREPALVNEVEMLLELVLDDLKHFLTPQCLPEVAVHPLGNSPESAFRALVELTGR